MDAVAERRRTDRGDLPLTVNYRLLTLADYLAEKGTIQQIAYRAKESPKLDAGDTGNKGPDSTSDSWIVDLLLQMDEKMDRILSLLTEKVHHGGSFYQGVGVNISGSGMKLRVDRPVESGNAIHTEFVLSRSPYVRLNLFGEIVQVTLWQEDGNTIYDLGIEFLDIDQMAKDQITARVSQMRRKAVRKADS